MKPLPSLSIDSLVADPVSFRDLPQIYLPFGNGCKNGKRIVVH